MIGKGSSDQFLKADDVRHIVAQAIDSANFDGSRVLFIIPDGTRTMPMPQVFALLQKTLRPRVRQLDFLVALGTHAPMTDAQLSKLVGQQVVGGNVGDIHIFNHQWDDPRTFTQLGVIPATEIAGITGGLMSQDVPVKLNRLILDYDHIVICGPVFPHEVVGFSGGNKYFFPGIGGSEIINFTHWLGAVITNYEVIGSGYTPVRAVIDRAAAMVPRPVSCFAFVVTHEGLNGLYFDTPTEAWKAASALSAEVHIRWVERPYRRVLAVMPQMYDDLWTAAKGMYKMEPAVADGGEVVIYSPSIDEVSYTHGKLIDEVGYHCRDYFLTQWERFKDYPGGVLAHSTHVKGLGTYDSTTDIEIPRVRVTLATGIPEERCRRINLNYLDPSSIRIDEWRGREAEGILVVPRAGEIVYRLKGSDAVSLCRAAST
jgi:nickel-dependent lactate racemase